MEISPEENNERTMNHQQQQKDVVSSPRSTPDKEITNQTNTSNQSSNRNTPTITTSNLTEGHLDENSWRPWTPKANNNYLER